MEDDRELIRKILFSKELLFMIPGEDSYFIRGTEIKITGLEIESLNRETPELFLKDLKELLDSKHLTLFLKYQIKIDEILKQMPPTNQSLISKET